MKTKTQLISILILLLSYPCFVMARETANKTSSHNKSSAIKPSGNNRNPPSNNRPPVSKPESNKPPTNNQRPQAPKPETNKPPTSNSRPPISKPESSKPPTNNNRPPVSRPEGNKPPTNNSRPPISKPESNKPPTNNTRPPISKPEGNKPPTNNSRPPISKPGGNKPPTNNHRPPISKPEGNKPPLNNSKPPRHQQNNSTTINEYYDYDIENNYYGYYDNQSTATRSNKKTDKNELDPGTALLIATSSFPTLTTMTLYKVFTEQGENSKQVALLRAQQDAMLFIASDGEHKGVYLENILNQLREQQQLKTHTELELAQAILVLE